MCRLVPAEQKTSDGAGGGGEGEGREAFWLESTEDYEDAIEYC